MWNLVLTGVSGILLGVLFSMQPRSQFDFEGKVLEMVIRNELLLKDTLEKITEIRMRIMDDNVKLNEAQLEVTKKKLDESVKAIVDTVMQHVSGAVKEINTTVNALVETTVDKIDTFIAATTKNMALVDTFVQHVSGAVKEINTTVKALVNSSLYKVDTFIAAATENMALVDTVVYEAVREIDTTVKALVDSTVYKVEAVIAAAAKNMTQNLEKWNALTTAFFEPRGGQVCSRNAGYSYMYVTHSEKIYQYCVRVRSDVIMSWHQAQSTCKQDGGNLVVFHDKDEGKFFDRWLQSLHPVDKMANRYWVGATDEDSEDNWAWVDGVAIPPGSYPDYFWSGEPNDAGGRDGKHENCAAANLNWIYEIGALNDVSCETLSNFICEIKL